MDPSRLCRHCKSLQLRKLIQDLDETASIHSSSNLIDVHKLSHVEFYECASLCDICATTASCFQQDVDVFGDHTGDPVVIVSVRKDSDQYRLQFTDKSNWNTISWTFCENGDNLIDLDPMSEKSLSYVLKSLSYCDQNHGNCTKSEPEFMPTRLIDVGAPESQKVRLVLSRNQEVAPYAALSYCWGKSKPLKTTIATITQHLQGIDISMLPQTLKDAVAVTRRLGIRYLWIDSLCIVQDDEADWFHEAATMASLYGDAQITIMAARSSSSEEGFLAPRVRPLVIKEERGQAGQKLSFYLTKCKFYHNIITMGTNQRENPLFKRAWVVQERILSRRKIIFCEDQVFWECNQLVTSEDKQISQEKQEQHVQGLSEWFDAVQTFMACDITHEKDILPAMAGIARSTAQATGFTYCAGIWLDRFPGSLLWYPQPQTKKIRREIYVAPTFSWAASKGPVWYRGPSTSYTFTKFCKYITYVQSLHEGNEDPYSAISAAGIVLEGPVLTVTRLIRNEYGVKLVFKLKNGQRYVVPAQFDHEDSDFDSDNLVVLPLYNDESRMQALVLQRMPTVLSGSCLQRVGISWCALSHLAKMNWWGNLVDTKPSEKEEEFRRFVEQVQTQKETVILN